MAVGLAFDKGSVPDGGVEGLGVGERYGAIPAVRRSRGGLADIGGDVGGRAQVVNEPVSRLHA